MAPLSPGGRGVGGEGDPHSSGAGSPSPPPPPTRGEGARNPMNLAFSTNAYLKFPFAEAARRLTRLGYRGLEIMADVPHAWPSFLLEEQKQSIRDSLKLNGLAISNVNAFMMNAVNDPRQRYWYPSWIEPD